MNSNKKNNHHDCIKKKKLFSNKNKTKNRNKRNSLTRCFSKKPLYILLVRKPRQWWKPRFYIYKIGSKFKNKATFLKNSKKIKTESMNFILNREQENEKYECVVYFYNLKKQEQK